MLWQAFPTVAGQTYTLSFDAGILSYNSNSQTMRVTANGAGNVFTQLITLSKPGGGSNLSWLPQSFTFVADSASTTLAFDDQSDSSTDLDLLLDNVRVTGSTATLPVPPGLDWIGPASLTGGPGDSTVGMNATRAGIYLIETSNDLVTWEILAQIQASQPGSIEFHDTRNLQVQQESELRIFYRIGLLPAQ